MKSNNINLKDFNLRVRPTDDFFEFANGGWIKSNPIPHDQAKWGTFTILRELSNSRLKKIFGELRRKSWTKNSNQAKLRDYYLSGLNLKRRNEGGLKEIESLICQIDGVKNYSEMFHLVGRFHEIGVEPFWLSVVDWDDKNSKRYIFRLYQGGLTLPEREYYLKKDKHFKKIRQAYLQYISSIFSLAGLNAQEAKKNSRIIMKIETRLASFSFTGVERRDLNKMYNKLSLKELLRKYPKIDWHQYFIGA